MPSIRRTQSHDDAPDLSKAYIRLCERTEKAIQNEEKLLDENLRHRKTLDEACVNADQRNVQRIRNLLDATKDSARECRDELRSLRNIMGGAVNANFRERDVLLAADTLERIVSAAETDARKQQSAVEFIMALCAESEREHTRDAFRNVGLVHAFHNVGLVHMEKSAPAPTAYADDEFEEIPLASDYDEPTAVSEQSAPYGGDARFNAPFHMPMPSAQNDVMAALRKIDALFDRLETASTARRTTLGDLFQKSSGWFRSAASRVGLVWRFLAGKKR